MVIRGNGKDRGGVGKRERCRWMQQVGIEFFASWPVLDGQTRADGDVHVYVYGWVCSIAFGVWVQMDGM
jgi:hypothetical protein